MKYNVGDKVRIKSIDWYNESKDSVDSYDVVFANGWVFSKPMSNFCGKELIIEKISHATNPPHYIMKDNIFRWTDEMIECKVGEENTLKTQSDNMETETHRGYYTTEPETTSEGKKRCVVYFWDSDFADKVELDLSGGRELIQEDGKWFVVKKKKEYPKTYEECCRVVNANSCIKLVYNLSDGQKYYHDEDNLCLYENFRRLKICRDAYWKLYGEEMGFGKPWAPDWNNVSDKYCIYFVSGYAWSKQCQTRQCPFAFPTPEMRDVFYEAFKNEIESCKELL